MISLIVPVVIVALVFGGSYYWARRQGLLTTGQTAEGEHGERRSFQPASRHPALAQSPTASISNLELAPAARGASARRRRRTIKLTL